MLILVKSKNNYSQFFYILFDFFFNPPWLPYLKVRGLIRKVGLGTCISCPISPPRAKSLSPPNLYQTKNSPIGNLLLGREASNFQEMGRLSLPTLLYAASVLYHQMKDFCYLLYIPKIPFFPVFVLNILLVILIGLFFQFVQEIVSVIFSVPPRRDCNARFTTVPLKALCCQV